jgi:hypothetical protein
VSVAPLAYRWSLSEFVRAWEARSFDHRVELVEGEIWPVVVGTWHGRTASRVIRALPEDGAQVTTETLPTGESLPDPDCCVLRTGAEPVGRVGTRLSVWNPADVLLVVEVSDETVLADLEIKARLYGRAGYAVYWVVTPEVVYAHTEPTSRGYRTRIEFRPGERIQVPYADKECDVVDLIGQ